MDDDLKLLREYAESRNANAFAELAKRYAGMVYGVCLRVTGSEHDAEDVSQECFLELTLKAGSVERSLPGWLHSTATRRSKDSIRRAMARRRHEEQAMPKTSNASERTWAEVAPHIDAAIEQLPDELRLAIILHYLQGRSQTEVAQMLSVSQPTVSRRIDDGITQLRDRLKKAGFIVSAVMLAGLLAENAACSAPAAVTAAAGKMAVSGIGEATGGGGFAAGSSATSALTTLKAKVLFGIVAAGAAAACTTAYYARHPAAPQIEPLRSSCLPVELPRVAPREGFDLYGDALPAGAVARLGTTRFRNGHYITDVDFSPNGSLIASGSFTSTAPGRFAGYVSVHDAGNGKIWRTFGPCKGGLISVEFSPDSSHLAIAGKDAPVTICSLQTGRQRETLLQDCVSVSWSMDGTRLAALGFDGTLRILSIPADVILWENAGTVSGMEYASMSQVHYLSPNLIACSNGGDSIGILNARTGKIVRLLEGFDRPVGNFAVSPDGWLVAAGPRPCRAWRVSTGECIFEDKTARYAHFVAFRPDSRSLVYHSGSQDVGELKVVDVITGKQLHQVERPRWAYRFLALDPSGTIAALTYPGTVSISYLDVKTGQLRLTTKEEMTASLRDLAVRSDGREIAVAGSHGDEAVQLWDWPNPRPGFRIAYDQGNPLGIRSLTYAGEKQYVALDRNGIDIWETAGTSGKIVGQLSFPGDRTIKPEWGDSTLVCSPDGSVLAGGDSNRVIGLWRIGQRRLGTVDSRSGKIRPSYLRTDKELTGHAGHIYSLSFSGDGRRIISSSEDGTVRLWDCETGEQLRIMEIAGNGQRHQKVFAVAYHPKVDRACGLREDGCIVVWDAATGKQVLAWQAHPSARMVYCAVAFSPGGKMLASGSSQGTVEIWNPETGDRVRTYSGHLGGITSLAFMPDGQYLVSGSTDTTALIWDLQPKE